MSTFFEIKEYSIPAGGSKHINRVGLYFFVVEATSAVDVAITRNNSLIGRGIAMEAGWSHGPRKPGDEFHGLEISSNDGTAQTVKIAIGDNLSDYKRLIGSVDVLSLPATNIETMADSGYFLASLSNTPSLNQFMHHQLWNPATSGVNLLIEELSVSWDGTVDTVANNRNMIAYATDAAVTNDVTASYLENRVIGGSATSGAEFRYESSAALNLFGTFGFNSFWCGDAQNRNEAIIITDAQRGIVIPPGSGLIARFPRNITALYLYCYSNWRWREEAV